MRTIHNFEWRLLIDMGAIIAFFGSSVLVTAICLVVAFLLLRKVGKLIRNIILIAIFVIAVCVCCGLFTIFDIGQFIRSVVCLNLL